MLSRINRALSSRKGIYEMNTAVQVMGLLSKEYSTWPEWAGKA